MEPNLQNTPIQSMPPTIPDKHVKLLPMIIVGVVMLILGLGGGYLLFANKGQVKQVATQASPTTVQQVAPTSNVSPTITPTTNWKTYTNPTDGYSFQYPTDWQANLSNQSFGLTNPILTKDGYEISFEDVRARGGAVGRVIAKSEPVQLYGLSLSKVYLNTTDRLCTFSNELTTIPPSDCTNTFDTIFLTQATNITSVPINGENISVIHNEIFYFSYSYSLDSHLGGGFNVQFTTPSPISVSYINSNPYVATYNSFISKVDLTGVH
jgi:PsbP-like protein